MKKIFEIAKNSPLFQEIAFSDFEPILNCLAAKTVSYHKDDLILLVGDAVNSIGLIVAGGVKIIKEDRDGHITILTKLGVADIFGEVLACAGIFHSPVTVQAAAATEVLFIDYNKIIASCTNACHFHARLIKNMLRLLAEKSLMLEQKNNILAKRTIRDKLWCFFDYQRGAATEFSIPFNREELAHYLCVDRSALSNELGKMRDQGLIKFNKNAFEIL